MEGAVEREKKALDIGMYQAWHTAVLALNGYSGGLKGKSLSNFLLTGRDEVRPSGKSAQALAWAHSMKARGFDVQITRNGIN